MSLTTRSHIRDDLMYILPPSACALMWTRAAYCPLWLLLLAIVVLQAASSNWSQSKLTYQSNHIYVLMLSASRIWTLKFKPFRKGISCYTHKCMNVVMNTKLPSHKCWLSTAKNWLNNSTSPFSSWEGGIWALSPGYTISNLQHFPGGWEPARLDPVHLKAVFRLCLRDSCHCSPSKPTKIQPHIFCGEIL